MGKYEELPELFYPQGTGIPNLTARLIKREGDICMYERSDGIHEVFIVQKKEKRNIFGTWYPAHELYPGNEDFGKTAWCYTDRNLAEKRYEGLREHK